MESERKGSKSDQIDTGEWKKAEAKRWLNNIGW